MVICNIDIFVRDRAQEVATRQAIASLLRQSINDLKFDERSMLTGTIRLTTELTSNQHASIIALPGVQSVRIAHR